MLWFGLLCCGWFVVLTGFVLMFGMLDLVVCFDCLRWFCGFTACFVVDLILFVGCGSVGL